MTSPNVIKTFKMASSLASVPESLKAIQPYIKISLEHKQRDIIISYWCCYYACHTGLKIDKTSKESTSFLIALMDWMEKIKKERADNEAISNEVVAQAHIENYALKLFLWADNEDRSARFNKNVVKSFYSAGLIFDVLTVFGELTDEVIHNRKYAKWKATYIHNCLKSGEVPIPGPIGGTDDGQDDSLAGGATSDQSCVNTWNQPFSNPENCFSSSSNIPTTLVTPAPGVHAPPSTPSGSTLPSPSSADTTYTPAQAQNGVVLRPEDFHKAQKYCKWAGSALQYEDVSTAIDNLQKALILLTTGKDES